MNDFIECAELGLLRDIPVELMSLEKQNAELLKSKRLLKAVAICAIAGIGIIIIVEIVKSIGNENGSRNESSSDNRNENQYKRRK